MGLPENTHFVDVKLLVAKFNVEHLSRERLFVLDYLGLVLRLDFLEGVSLFRREIGLCVYFLLGKLNRIGIEVLAGLGCGRVAFSSGRSLDSACRMS